VSQFSAGTSFRWVRDNFYPELANRQEGYSRIAADAARSSEARPHFVPYLSGAGAPHWSHGARGALAGLSFDHGRREIAAAVLEGVAREAAVGASQLRSQGARSLVIDGGLTRSARFARLFAALSPLPVFRSRVVEATALGAAMIAAVGTGAHRDLRSAVAAMVARPARVPTDPGSMRGLALRQEEWSFWAANALDPEDR
jgi:sugar (pentulose or hexulose) kinase